MSLVGSFRFAGSVGCFCSLFRFTFSVRWVGSLFRFAVSEHWVGSFFLVVVSVRRSRDKIRVSGSFVCADVIAV